MSWLVCKISDVFDVARGGSPRPIQNYLTDSADGLNWIMIGDASDDSKYITATKKKIRPEGLKKTRMVHEGDFLLTNSMSFGRPYILKTSGCIHDGWLVLSPKDDQVFPDFFYYLFGSDALYREFSRRAAGAVVKNLNSSLVRQVQIPLPPLAEQKRIAGILDAADALRAKRRESLAQLDTLLQSTFLDMFGDPVTNPMGWEKTTLKDFSTKVTDGDHHTPKRTDSGIKLLSARNVLDGDIDLSNTDFVGAEEYERMIKRCHPEKGDVLISCSGSIGRVSRIRFDEPIVLVRSAALVKIDHEKAATEFVEHLLRTPALKAAMLRSAKSSSQANLFQKPIRNLPVVVPPRDLQNRFAAIVESVERQKASQRAHLDELDTLFASLQSRAFRGDL